MKVRITKGSGWYKDKAGEIFDVDDVPSPCFLRMGVRAYPVTKSEIFVILADECEVVLPKEKFDPVYERCDKETGNDEVARELEQTWREVARELEQMYLDEKKKNDWYKLDPSFDKLVDDPKAFAQKVADTNVKLWGIIFNLFYERDSMQRGMALIALHKSGIIRKGGAMPEKPNPFYWDGDVMKADWSKVEVAPENALELSIEGWRQYVAELESRGRVLDKQTASCSLCELHNAVRRCCECPIKRKTKQYGCHGTPWYSWRDAARANHYPDTLRYAKEMLEYLEAL